MKKFYLFASLLLGLFVLYGSGAKAQAVTGVSLDKHTMSLALRAHDSLQATITPANAQNKNLIWKSSNEDIIYISDWGTGLAIASASHDGVATITVKTEDGGFTDSCIVTCRVDTAANINAFAFSGQAYAAKIDEAAKLIRAFIPHDADFTQLTVSSYEISPDATISPLPETVHDFSDTVSFVVTAPDGKTQKTWKVVAERMPDLTGTQKVKLTFSTAPQGWIGDTVSWEEAGIHFLVNYPDPSDSSWPPSAAVGVDYDYSNEVGISLFPARLEFYLEDTSKVIVAASMYVLENCGDSCTYAAFSGENNSKTFYLDKMTRSFYFFNLTNVKAASGTLRSYESSFSGITFWIANKDGSVNHPPVANAGHDQTVYPGDTVQLDGSASFDPDQQALHYSWAAPHGIALDDSTLAKPSFVAPNELDTLHLTFVLTVSDGSLNESDSVVVTVIPTNHRPVANAGPDQTVFGNDSVYLNGTASTDADGDSLRYMWMAPGGIHLTDSTSPSPAFKAPDVQQTTVFSFALIVNDGLVNSVLDTVFITVKHKNQAPVAWLEFDSTFVHEGDTAYIDGHYSYDPDGDSLRFHWWTDPGSGITFFDSTAMDVRCGTPMVEHDTTFRVYLKVDDGTLYSQPDTIYVKVENVNAVPVAVLRKHTAPVYDGDTVYLDGTGSYDRDGDSLTYKWMAPKGIWLSDSGATAWFVAPIVQKSAVYYVSLVVNDGNADSPPAIDTIVVVHKNHAPVAVFDVKSGSVNEGDTAYIDGHYSYDPDGDSLRYHWWADPGSGIRFLDSTAMDIRCVAPMVKHDTTFHVYLKVDDGKIISEPDTFNLKVLNVNHAPVADIVSTSPIFYGVSMNEGDTLWIDGSPSYDPDGDSITYDWALPKDFTTYHYDSVKVMVIAHEVSKTTSFDAALFVSDGALRSRKDFIIQVLNVNKAPYAFAGKPFSVLSGKTDELDGSQSYDPDGDSLLFTWTAPAGITLSDVHAVSPTFRAPEVTSDQVFTFKLVVSDGKLLSDTSRVEVTVKPIAATLSVTATLNDDTISYRNRHITLYWRDDNNRWVMESVLSYNENGETYYAVWQGDWMISVDPVGDNAGFVSTFSGDVAWWTDGNAVSITAGSETHINIHCLPAGDNLTGNGMIDGYIQRDTTTAGTARSTITHVDNNASGDVPAVGVTVYLYRSADDKLLASSLTGDDGRYVFDNLPFDAYYLLVQLPGYDANTPWPVEVTENDTVVNNVNFLVSEGSQEITGVNDRQEMQVKLYPNPVKTWLNIRLDAEDRGAEYRMYDITGHLMMTGVLENSVNRLDIGHLNKGIYLLNIRFQNSVITRRIIKQ